MGLSNLLKPGFAFILIYQPVPFSIPSASAAVNPAGNLLGLSPNGGDQMWMASSVSWLTSQGDKIAYTAATRILDDIKTHTQTKYAGVVSSNCKAGGTLTSQYSPPIFMNDAMYDQEVLQGYGNSTYARLKSIQRWYDPSGMFTSRTNGFK